MDRSTWLHCCLCILVILGTIYIINYQFYLEEIFLLELCLYGSEGGGGSSILQVKTVQCCMYEVRSIKNANLFIKYEGIKLQKCLIACKKGINIVVRFQYSEIG